MAEKLSNAIVNNNVAQLQKIEDGLLQNARADFEFLSRSEYEVLSRSKQDRNLCAHPAFVEEGVLFQPTPELVRTHIVHAVMHLLRHRPVQGKGALKRIVEDLARPSFPQDKNDAAKFLHKKYLDRAKEALVRNLAKLLLKELLRGESTELNGKEKVVLNSFLAISSKFALLYEELVKENLSAIVDSLSDEQLPRLFGLLAADQRCWNWLDEPSKLRVKHLVQSLDFQELSSFGIFELLPMPEFQQTLLERFDDLEVEQKMQAISAHPYRELSKQAATLYSQAWSFRSAETLGENVLLPMAKYFSADEVAEILTAIRENSQISYASGTPDIMVRFFEKTKHLYFQVKSEWSNFLATMPTSSDEHYSYPQLRKKITDFENAVST